LPQISRQARNFEKAQKRIKDDALLKNLLTRTPDEVITWYSTATPQQKDDVILRLILVVQFLLKGEVNG